MARDAFFFSHQSPTASSRDAEVLWTLTRDGVFVVADLLVHSSGGVELRIVQDGERQSGRRFAERAHALAQAEGHRAQLVARGWRRV